MEENGPRLASNDFRWRGVRFASWKRSGGWPALLSPTYVVSPPPRLRRLLVFVYHRNIMASYNNEADDVELKRSSYLK